MHALKEKEVEVSVEIVLKKIEGYVITNYLYLINVKVSISISTDSRPFVNRQIPKTMEKIVGPLLANSRPTVGRQLTNCRLTVSEGELFLTITASCVIHSLPLLITAL